MAEQDLVRLDNARYQLVLIAKDLSLYADNELRSIKNTADVFSMHIRIELAARDARMVDEALALLPAWVRKCPYANCRRCDTEQECPAYREEKSA
jgi:predicted Zn-ribbon and HTH transcriptional regulator